jgi:catechol 2,3-dioxygenase-like lactoylglutathione lyase family enzyme
MRVLRHQGRVEEGEASAGSKTMMGYGPEDSNFVLEVLYTPGKHASDKVVEWFQIRSRVVYGSIVDGNLGEPTDLREMMCRSPGNGNAYTFFIVGEDPDLSVGPLETVCLSVTNIERSLEFYTELLGLLEVGSGDDYVTLSCGFESAFLIRLHLTTSRTAKSQRDDLKNCKNHLAFAFTSEEMSEIQTRLTALKINFTEATDLFINDVKTTLTGGLHTGLRAIQTEDPDRTRILLITDQPYRELSHTDDAAPQLVEKEIAKACHKDWFVRKETNLTE